MGFAHRGARVADVLQRVDARDSAERTIGKRQGLGVRADERRVDACLAGSAARPLRADASHWSLFRELCERADCRGNLVQDAYLAALALEHNCTYITTDRDFSRFPRLRWQHPLEQDRPTQNPK